MAFSLRTNDWRLLHKCSMHALMCFAVAGQRRLDLGGGAGWTYAYALWASLSQHEYWRQVGHPIQQAIETDLACVVEEEAESYFGYLGQCITKETQKAAFDRMNDHFVDLPNQLATAKAMEGLLQQTGVRSLGGRSAPIEDSNSEANQDTRVEVRRHLLAMVTEVIGEGLPYAHSFFSPKRYKGNRSQMVNRDTSDMPLKPVMQHDYLLAALQHTKEHAKMLLGPLNWQFKEQEEEVQAWLAGNSLVDTDSGSGTPDSDGLSRLLRYPGRGAEGAVGGEGGGGRLTTDQDGLEDGDFILASWSGSSRQARIGRQTSGSLWLVQ